jgi:predicted ATP-binding protein involved in virulence
MKINTLRVQNFKNFEDKTLGFSDQFNLIIGDNGTGKTALLDAVAVAAGAFLLGIDDKEVTSRHIRWHEVRVRGFMQETYTLEQQYPTRITATGEVMHKLLDWSRALESSRGRTTRKEAERIRKLASEAQIGVRSGENTVLPVIAYYSTARLWLEKKDMDKNETVQSIQYGLGASYGRNSADSPSPNLKPYSRLNGYAGALDVAISSKRLMRWFLRMELIELQNHQTVLAYQAVKEAIKNCLENCNFVYFDINYGDVIAVLSNGPMPLHLLSDGQRAMLTMVADIAYRMAVLNPHLLENVTLETPGVVLIDEIDLHLHPNWQRNVVEDLRKAFPKVQFFISSHSPFIVQSMRPGELIDLNEIPGAAEFQNQSIEDITENSMGVELPQRSERHQQMFEAAKEYYEALEQAKGAENAQLEEVKQKLDELSAPFSDDMAYHAFLEMERLAALKDKA